MSAAHHPGGAESLATGHRCTIPECSETIGGSTMEAWHLNVRAHYLEAHGVIAPEAHSCRCLTPVAKRVVLAGANAGRVHHEPSCPRWRP